MQADSAPSAPSTAPIHRPWIKIVTILVVLLLAGLGYLLLASEKAAPAVRFTDLKGQEITLQSLRGKVVIVNFWATSCTTCIQEMPQMIETYNKFNSQGLEFIAVAMQYDRADYVVNYAQTRRLPFTVALDTKGNIAQAFGDVKLTPTTFVIDKKGNIIKRYVGIPDFPVLHQLLGKILAA